MPEETVVAASSAEQASTPVGQPITVQIPERWKDMDVSRGPLVDITPEERAEFRKTGELPMPKKEDAAPSSEPNPVEGEAKPAGDSEPPKKTQDNTDRKPKQTAEERIAQLEATIEKIRKGSGKETPKVESSPTKPEPVQQSTRPKPTADDKSTDGKLKYETYEDFVEDLADWKSEQREVKNQRERQEQNQAKQLNDKVADARTRYDNFDEVMKPALDTIANDPHVNGIVKQMLNDSELLPDLLFTIGSSEKELASFVKMAKESPRKAIEYIVLTESLIADELGKKTVDSSKTEEPPVKPRTQAPKPPSEAGGRAAAPPDALESAAKANDFRSFKTEANRRAIAKLKG